MKKIGIIGDGQLGHRLFQMLGSNDGLIVKVYSRKSGFDIEDITVANEIVNENDVIINCAAMTDVNGCEQNEDLAIRVNSIFPAYVGGIIAADLKKKFVHISTDYVYGDAEQNTAHLESEKCSPLNAYGRSKLLADEALLKMKALKDRLLILRPAWLFDYEGKNNVINRIYRMAIAGEEIRAATNLFVIPTECTLVGNVIKNFIDDHFSAGLYNIRNMEGSKEERPSVYDIATLIADEVSKINLTEKVNVVGFEVPAHKIDEMHAQRQLNSILDITELKAVCYKHGCDSIKNWKNAVIDFIKWKTNENDLSENQIAAIAHIISAES